MDPTRLAWSTESADGRVGRWGGDEADGASVPQGTRFSTAIPSGNRDAECTLARGIGRDYPDLRLRDNVRIYGPGNRTAWEGRIHKLPRSHGSGFGITVSCVGHARLLSERPGFGMVYCERAFSGWGQTPLARAIEISTAGIGQGDLSWQSSGDALTLAYPRQSLGPQTLGEVAYKAPAGARIASVMYQGAHTNPPASWVVALDAADTDILAGAERYTPNLDNTLRTITLTTARRNLFLFIWSNGAAAATPTAGALSRVSKLALYGDHGVTTRAVAGEPDGFYVPDIVADIVARTAPGLNFTTGAGGSIQDDPDQQIIPHLVYADTNGGDAILFANAYRGWPWGVYDNREFFYRPWDPDRLTWRVRQSDGAHLTFEGEDAEEVPNGVFVTYTNPDGVQHTIGPPGSTAETTDASLENTDPANPVNEHGEQYWIRLNISQTTTEAAAIALGSRWLTEKSEAPRRGTLVVRGMGATHPTEGPCPVWRMRAGDHVTVEDHSASIARRIISTDYDHDTRTLTCALDNTSHETEALMELYGVALMGVV